jgi:hypothetical protein
MTGDTGGAEPPAQAPAGGSASVPKWFPIAGVAFAAATLLFFMALTLFGNALRIGPESRFAVIAVFSLGVGLSASFLGGTAAAEGKIPLPFAQANPLQFSLAGGVAVVMISMLLASALYNPGKPPVVEPTPVASTPSTPNPANSTQPPTPITAVAPTTPAPVALPVSRDADRCYYFHADFYDEVRVSPVMNQRQIDWRAGILTTVGRLRVVAFQAPGDDPRFIGILADRRINAVLSHLQAQGVHRSIIEVDAALPPLPAAYGAYAIGDALCLVMVIPDGPFTLPP